MPELLTYQWSPATAYAAVNSIAELNQKRSEQAQSMALQLAQLAQKHEDEAARAAEAAKKLDYDQQQQLRVNAIAAGRNTTAQDRLSFDRQKFAADNSVIPDSPLPTGGASSSIGQDLLKTPDLTGAPSTPASDNSWMDYSPVSRAPDAPVAVDQAAADAQAFQDSKQTPAQRIQAESMALPVDRTPTGPTSLDLTGGSMAEQLMANRQHQLHQLGVPTKQARQSLGTLGNQLAIEQFRSATRPAKSVTGQKPSELMAGYIDQNGLSPTDHGTYANADGAEFLLNQVANGRITAKAVDLRAKAKQWVFGSDGQPYALGTDGQPMTHIPEGVTVSPTKPQPKTLKTDDGAVYLIPPDGGDPKKIIPPGLKLTQKDKDAYLKDVLDAAKAKTDADAKAAALAKKSTTGLGSYFGVDQNEVDKAQKDYQDAQAKVTGWVKAYPQLGQIGAPAPATTPAPVAALASTPATPAPATPSPTPAAQAVWKIDPKTGIKWEVKDGKLTGMHVLAK